MGTLFRHAFERYRGSILGWGLSLAVLSGYLLLFYDSLAEEQDLLMELIQSYPPELLAFFGGMDEMFTPAGFLNAELFSYLPIILGIFTVLSGSGMLVTDEEDGILDLVMGHPISRTALFWGRWLAFLAATLAILLLMYIGLYIGMNSSIIDLSAFELSQPFLSLFPVLLLFGCTALLLSMLLPSRRLAAMIAGIVMVGSFFLTSLARLDDRLETAARFSPLNYYQGGMAIGGLEWGWFGGLLAIALLFTVLAWWLFERRDIRVGGEGGWKLTGRRSRRELAPTQPN